MGGKTTGDYDRNMAPFSVSGSLRVLPRAGFKHLAGVETGVLAQDHMR